ncbi:MAG: M48 family metalloprotease [Pseudomonadota bacterium]
MNSVRTGVLLAAMTALFLFVGYMIGGATGMVLALIFAAVTNGIAFWGSDRIALSRHRAQPVTVMSHRGLIEMVARLSAQAGIPAPRVYLMDSNQANAFATGRDPENAAVAVTRGLLRHLSTEEVEGVIAHELAHIRNRDTLTMTVAATFAGAISVLANIGFWLGGNRQQGHFGRVGVLIAAILAPTAAALVQMAVSRTREYAADRAAAEITGNPLAMASALRTISNQATWSRMPQAEANPGSAHMFIVNPLVGLRIDRLFSTHPPTPKRIAALEAMAYEGGYRQPRKETMAERMNLRPTSVPKVLRR